MLFLGKLIEQPSLRLQEREPLCFTERNLMKDFTKIDFPNNRKVNLNSRQLNDEISSRSTYFQKKFELTSKSHTIFFNIFNFFFFFWISSIILLHIIAFYYMLFYTHEHTHTRTHAHTQNCHYNFLLQFLNCPCNTDFLPMFPSAYKTNHIYATVIIKPLFSQNVLGLTLMRCIVFIPAIFPWLYVKRFQSTEIKPFCLRL